MAHTKHISLEKSSICILKCACTCVRIYSDSVNGFPISHNNNTYHSLTSHDVFYKILLCVVCAENHVRSWSVARFRGCISTQPGSTSGSSFKVLSLEGASTLLYPSVSIGKCLGCHCLHMHIHTPYNRSNAHLQVLLIYKTTMPILENLSQSHIFNKY